MKVLILDNYDSFTYNLFHYVDQLCDDVTVMRNDEITVEAVADYSNILISPGPGLPGEAGISMQVIAQYYTSKNIYRLKYQILSSILS